MKFGIFTMPEHYPWDNWDVAYQRDFDEIVLAEKLGFDEFWIGEHHAGNVEPVPCPELMIAKAAGLTHTIKLGTGSINLPYHDPFMVAERMAFLDRMTKGRLLYGFGGGALPFDQELFGIDRNDVRPMMNEALDIIRRLLSETEPFDYDGKYFHGKKRKLMVGPYKGRAPEIALTGLLTTNSYELAGANGWGSLSVYFTPPTFRDSPFPGLVQMGEALDRAAAEAGRPPYEARRNWRVVREVYVHPDGRKAALEEIKKGAAHSYYGYLFPIGLAMAMKQERSQSDKELTIEWMADNNRWILGSPDEVVKQIRELYEEVGGFGTFIINSRDWVTTDKLHRSHELFARYVIPQLEGLVPGEEKPRWTGRDTPPPYPTTTPVPEPPLFSYSR